MSIMSNDNDNKKIEPKVKETKVKPKGRPKKSKILSKTTGSRNKVGRPKGDASIINDYKARMLASPKSRKVLDSILSAALDDDHKNQAAAWKLCMDRLLPVSYFEKDKAGGGRGAINISITGVGGETTIISGNEQDIDDGDYTDV